MEFTEPLEAAVVQVAHVTDDPIPKRVSFPSMLPPAWLAVDAYEKGTGEATVKTYMILPIREYSGKEIRDVRKKAGMTQSVFASYMGVSIKTVEAWEGGRTHPTGPVFRLLDILSANDEMEYIVAK